MTRAELANKLRQYVDAQVVADNAGTDEEWAPLSDTANAIAIEILNEFDRMKPVYDAAMEYTRAYDEWDPKLDQDADEQGHWECWLRDACRWAKRSP